ncbi:MAG: Mammalian cell entry related domain protein, partial [Pedosphaera sp.]|nr:Mammalian cell entry related domain protein [Pedosphaera sp.]
NISDIVVHTDQFIQGLKRFWLFRHLFAAHKTKTPPPAPSTHQPEPLLSPKQKSGQQ